VILGTLNVANTLPVLFQALIFITIIKVDRPTLLVMLISSPGGATLVAGIVAKLSKKEFRLTMAVVLLVTAFFMLVGNMDWINGGVDTVGLYGSKLIIAGGENLVLDSFNDGRYRLYAPCMAVVIALGGISPQVAFSIMMGSCPFLMPPSSTRFIREGA
jgi:hypothetical protein